MHEDRLYISAHTDKREILKTLAPGEPYPIDDKGGIWWVPKRWHGGRSGTEGSSDDEVVPSLVCKTHEPYVIAADDVHVWFEELGGIRRTPKSGPRAGEIERVAYFNAFWVALDGEHAYILVPYSMFRVSQYDELLKEEEDITLTVHGLFVRAVTPSHAPYHDRIFTLESFEHEDTFNKERDPRRKAEPGTKGDRTLLLSHSKANGETSRLARFDGHGRQLAIVGDHAVVLIRGQPIRVVSLTSRDGPIREIPESEGVERFVVFGNRIYFPSTKAPTGTIRMMSTPVAGFTIERAADDFAFSEPLSCFTWRYVVHGGTVFYGETFGDDDHRILRADLL